MGLHADLDHKDIMIMCLVKQYSPLDSFPADGALGHPVSAHLTRAVTAEEDHVLHPVQAHGAQGLLLDVRQLLLQLHNFLRLVVNALSRVDVLSLIRHRFITLGNVTCWDNDVFRR